MSRSVCEDCKWYKYTPAKICIGSYYDSPPELECLEDSEQFMMDEGCYRYEEREEDYE